jgi:hypothetical protein
MTTIVLPGFIKSGWITHRFINDNQSFKPQTVLITPVDTDI